jgi:sugar phosphate isomerase/epimerase
MQLAFCSVSALDREVGAAARLAREAGCDGLEVTVRAPHLDPDAPIEHAREVGERVRDAGIDVVALGSYLGRGGRLAHDRAAHDVALATALGAPLLRVWAEEPGAEGGASFGEIVALLRAAAIRAGDVGVTVVVERHVQSWADTPERIERLLAAVGHPALALNYQVLDALPPEAVAEQPADAACLAPHARYVHLKNYRLNPTDAALPVVPGASLREGLVDYRAVLPEILRAGYNGPLTIEFLSWAATPLAEKLADDVAFVRDVLAESAAE